MKDQSWRFRSNKFILLAVVSLLIPTMFSCGHKADTVTAPSDHSKKAKKDLTVWFVKTKGDELEIVPVDRAKTGADLVESAVTQLLLGPDDKEITEGISSEIPRGTILLGIEQEGEKIELNLSKRFTSGGGPTSIQTRLDQLSKTVANVAGDSKVFLSIEGDRLTAAQFDGLEIKQPIN